ncbi:MAG TPA: AarF/ABC1/UbiB kinase family protein [Aliicoccus persicus]|uniref:AarF/ABC1/UbiB kinase family protein n=1 Tax=Aliicoccus persicus TaxID=930138 RepID=A0A921B5C1_9STAP|nr:AarF/ABC1/UbiB kinase family protein [Aliicoccus persicus]
MLFEKRIQYINRYREIAIALSKSGFGFIIEEIGLDEVFSLPKRILLRQKESDTKEKSNGERIVELLESLGPTFVKIGQLASTRPDILPQDIVKSLESLQGNVHAMETSVVKKQIELSLDASMDDIFLEFDEFPVGSASIGQVHKATLKTGEHVAVKVQRPNIERTIRNDLEILNHIAVLADNRLEIAKHINVTSVIDEFSKAIIDELDYTIEGRNQDKIRKQFIDEPTIKVPEVYWELTTKEVLVMEFIDGININEIDLLTNEGYDTHQIAENLTNALFHQILIEGFFHGDPHPGNIKVLPDETVALIDFGMVGRLSQEMKGNLGFLIIALMRQDVDGVVRGITRMGAVPDTVNIKDLRRDAEQLKDKYIDVPVSQIDLGQAIQEIFDIAHKHKIILPTDLTILGKAVLSLETIVTKLEPTFSILDFAEPFGKLLLRERLQFDNIKSSATRRLYRVSDNIEDISSNIHEFTKGLKHKKLPITLELETADKMLKRFDKLANRLSFSIILLSFSIIMVGLIISSAMSGHDSVIWQIPVIEIGTVIAALLFIGMFISILKSGRL